MARRSRRTYPDLKTYFEKTGDSQAAFGLRVNRSQSWVSRVTTGEIEPSLADAMLVSEAAGVPLESLIASSRLHTSAK